MKPQRRFSAVLMFSALLLAAAPVCAGSDDEDGRTASWNPPVFSWSSPSSAVEKKVDDAFSTSPTTRLTAPTRDVEEMLQKPVQPGSQQPQASGGGVSVYSSTGYLAEHMSGNGIQVFSLGESAPRPPQIGGSVPVQPFSVQGVAVGRDPDRVRIFPFEGGFGAFMPDMAEATAPAQGEVMQDQPMGLLTPSPRTFSGGQSADSSALARVFFPHNTTSLTGEGRSQVDQLARDYQTGAAAPLRVEGHASTRAETDDPVTRRIVNLKVSMDRALSVSRELIQKGVPAESIETSAYGDTQPPMMAPGMDAEAASRRVEIRAGR